jgi:signal transduction histidine kinase
MFFQRRTGLYVFLAFRWALLLIGLLMYARNNSITPELLLTAVLFQTLYSFAQIRNLPNTRLLTAIIDVCFSLYLISQTGGLSSPVLVYSFSGLITFKWFVTWNVYYSIILLYSLLVPLLFSSAASLSMHGYMIKHLNYSFVVLIFFICMGTIHYGIKVVRNEYRKLMMVYATSSYAASAKSQGVIPYSEGVLKKVLDDREVILCVTGASDSEKLQSWRQTYYTNYLIQNRPYSFKVYADLPSPTGEVLPFYIETLKNRQGNIYGWLLVQAGKDELTVLHKLYIHFLLIRLEADQYVKGELAHAAETAIAKERDIIAQNIHDGIAQELFFISIQLFQLKQSLPANTREEILPFVMEVEKKVKESHRDIRQFIIELKDEKRKINLHHAIEKLLQRVTEHTEVEPTFEKIGWIAHEQLDIEEAIYHLIEEAANNVIKHAQAKHIYVQIEVTSVQWAITIRDDGVGMKSSNGNSGGSYGLGGMESRIKFLNGAISFYSEPGKGTTITAYIPRERSMAYV